MYRCSSRITYMDPAKRCRGYLDADEAEARIWQAIEQVLQQPEQRCRIPDPALNRQSPIDPPKKFGPVHPRSGVIRNAPCETR